jgi:hypothetical protein
MNKPLKHMPTQQTSSRWIQLLANEPKDPVPAEPVVLVFLEATDPISPGPTTLGFGHTKYEYEVESDEEAGPETTQTRFLHK